GGDPQNLQIALPFQLAGEFDRIAHEVKNVMGDWSAVRANEQIKLFPAGPRARDKHRRDAPREAEDPTAPVVLPPAGVHRPPGTLRVNDFARECYHANRLGWQAAQPLLLGFRHRRQWLDALLSLGQFEHPAVVPLKQRAGHPDGLAVVDSDAVHGTKLP